MCKQYRVSYNSGVEKAFIVHRSEVGAGPDIKFVQHKCGLYIYQPKKQKAITMLAKTSKDTPNTMTVKENKQLTKDAKASIFVETVEDNMKSFTKKEIDGARKARRLYTQLCHPSDKTFKWMIRHGRIKNCDVTIRDIDVANQIWGKHLAALKGKTVMKSPGAYTL